MMSWITYYDRHHRIRSGLSRETHLGIAFTETMKAVDNRNTVHTLILDFREAFNVVVHKLVV